MANNLTFQPTRPLRGATILVSPFFPLCFNFNPRAPCGARPPRRLQMCRLSDFNPRAPCGARPLPARVVAVGLCISTHAPLAGRDGDGRRDVRYLGISTHAPLAGRDNKAFEGQHPTYISTHAPLAGRDGADWVDKDDSLLFQPTRPLRGATAWCACRAPGSRYFNPRAPCGARPMRSTPSSTSSRFQPTRPLRGATGKSGGSSASNLFQPTRPLRGATQPTGGCTGVLPSISTHAPLAGRDVYRRRRCAHLLYISTHAPLAGRDRSDGCGSSAARDFNPRAPCGARPLPASASSPSANFNPRAPCGARQQKCTNHYAHFCDNRQISDAFAQNAACQGILLLFDAGKPCGFWVRTAQVISARLCFAL